MAVDLADEVRKRKVADDLGFESADYESISDAEQGGPVQNYVLTPIEQVGGEPQFESIEDQPLQSRDGSDWISMASPTLRGALLTRFPQPPAVPSPLPPPSAEASDDRARSASDWLSLAQPEAQAPPPRAELVKLPPTTNVALASREQAAPAVRAIPVEPPPQPVAMATREMPPPAIGAQSAQPEVRRAELVAQPPTPQPPVQQPPAPQPPTPQPPAPQAPAPQLPGQNYVLTPIDRSSGQPIVQPAQPAKPTGPTPPAVQQPVTATEESEITNQAQPGSYQHYLGSEPRVIRSIVLHSSDGHEKGDINTLTTGGVSSHYYTTRDGRSLHFVADNDIAYHAGKNINPDQYGNAVTIGIEQEHIDGQPWDEAQVKRTAQTVAEILQRHPELSINNVLGHSDIAPERKQDPLNFPWDRFRGYVQQYLGQQVATVAAAPIAQPATKTASGFYQNEDPKTFTTGWATTFATSSDIASGKDPGVGSPKLGKLNTTQAAGVALPQWVLQSQLGNNPAAWRKARIDVVDQQSGRRLRLPIVDIGPGTDQENAGVVVDMTPWVSNYFGGDKNLSVKLVPNAGPDVNKNPGSWADEQASIKEGHDSGTLVSGAVKVQKPQNYVLAPVAPLSAEAVQADKESQQKQIGILQTLPEAQGNSLPDLYRRLDKPVDGVNPYLQKSFQNQIKAEATKYAQDNYGIKDPDEAFKRIMQPAGVLDYGAQLIKDAGGHMLSMVSSFNANMASKDEDNAIKVLKLVNPNASPEQISDTMKHLLSPDLSHRDREKLIRDAIMVPYSQLDEAHQGTFDLAGAVESIRRLSDPKYMAERQKVIDQQVGFVNNLFKPDPRLNPAATKALDWVSQIPANILQLLTGPLGASLMLSDIYKGTVDKLKSEHPEMSAAQVQDMAGRSALAQAVIQEGIGRVAALGGFGPALAGIENPVARIAANAGAHLGLGGIVSTSGKAIANIAEGRPMTEGLGEAAIAGAIQAVPGAVIGGFHRPPETRLPLRPEEAVRAQVPVERPPVTEERPPVEQPPLPKVPVTQEDVARRAYEISQERERSGQPGDHLSDWHQAQEELSQATEPILPVTVSEAEPFVSAIANRYTAERAAQGEIGEVVPGEGVSTEALLAKGLRMGPEEINQHVSDVMNNRGGDPIAQAAAVRAEEARLSQRSNAASRAFEANPSDANRAEADNAFKDLTDFHNGPVAKIKSIFHGVGMGLQGEIPIDLSTFNGLREAFLKNVGKPPPLSMEPKLKQMAEVVSKSADAERVALSNLGKEIEKVTRGKTLPTDDQIRTRLLEIMKDLPCRT